jgi:hypothetical protein
MVIAFREAAGFPKRRVASMLKEQSANCRDKKFCDSKDRDAETFPARLTIVAEAKAKKDASGVY